MPKFEKIRTPEEKEFEKFAAKYLEVLQDKKVPNIYKVLLRQKGFLLVLGKLKPMSEMEWNPEILDEWKKIKIWQDRDFNGISRLLLKKFNLHSSKIQKSPEIIKFKIYDQDQVKDQIKKIPQLLAWDTQKNIEEWIEDNINAGINRDLIYGTLYGFPKSAIEFYIKHHGLAHILHQNIGTYGENYGVEKGNLPEDVKLREKQKKNFFQKLSKDTAIQNEFKKLDPLKDKLIAIKNKEILKRTKYQVDTRKEYE